MRSKKKKNQVILLTAKLLKLIFYEKHTLFSYTSVVD